MHSPSYGHKKRHPLVSDQFDGQPYSAQRDDGHGLSNGNKKPLLLLNDDMGVDLYHNDFGCGFLSLGRLVSS